MVNCIQNSDYEIKKQALTDASKLSSSELNNVINELLTKIEVSQNNDEIKELKTKVKFMAEIWCRRNPKN